MKNNADWYDDDNSERQSARNNGVNNDENRNA